MVERSDSRGKWIAITIIGVLAVLVVVVAVQIQSGRPHAGSPAAVAGSASATAASAAPKRSPAMRTGTVDALTNGLDEQQLEQASALGAWLTQWEELDFESGDGADLRGLAADYKDIGLDSKKVRKRLRDTAELIEKGEAATDDRRYQAALDDYDDAAAKIKIIPALLRTDVAKAEATTGARITPQVGKRYEGYDYLFPVSTEGDDVTVKAWIDGDTVETSAGRVRLIGVDTPEMKDQCSRAQSAKEYAESLAPAGAAITLTNPDSVNDTDRYGRLLRYVDVEDAGAADDDVIDVGYSMIVNSLAVARYDSQDRYQWHPREKLYRASSDDATVDSDQCRRIAEKAAFVLAATSDDDDDSDEHWRHRILGPVLSAPYRSAKKHLPKIVADTRQAHVDQDRLKQKAEQRAAKKRQRREAAQREQRETSRRQQRQADQRETGQNEQREPRQRQHQQRDSDNSGSSNGSEGKGGGAHPGYTGPRCYGPGGKTWKPC